MEKKLFKKYIYMLQFIDRTIFMASSLLNLANNPSVGVHRIEYKLEHSDKKCESCGITYEVCNCFLEYTNFKR